MTYSGPGGGGYNPGGPYGGGSHGAPPAGGYGGPAQPPGYGAPPGYPQAPGYGPPGAPHGPPPAKKTKKVLLLVGLGCGFFVVAGAVIAALLLWRAKQEYDAAAQAVSSALGTTAPGQTSATCQQAVACCRKVAEHATAASPDPSARAAATTACDALLQAGLPELACTQALAAHRAAASSAGVSCD